MKWWLWAFANHKWLHNGCYFMESVVLTVQGIKRLSEISCGRTWYTLPWCFKMYKAPWLACSRHCSSSLKIWISSSSGWHNISDTDFNCDVLTPPKLLSTTTWMSISSFCLGKKKKKVLVCKRVKLQDAVFILFICLFFPIILTWGSLFFFPCLSLFFFSLPSAGNYSKSTSWYSHML